MRCARLTSRDEERRLDLPVSNDPLPARPWEIVPNSWGASLERGDPSRLANLAAETAHARIRIRWLKNVIARGTGPVT